MRRTLAVVVIALWAVVGLPGTAHAGGPTSVLITQPATGEATALYNSAGAYADLERLLAGGGAKVPTSEASVASGGTLYNLTWMIHDVHPWRTDTVQITRDGAAYVTTTLESESGLGGEASWREVAQPRALAALLDQVFSGVAAKSAPLPAMAEEPLTEPAAAAAAPDEQWFSLAGWRWVVPGALVGLIVGLVARRRQVPGEPRRALIDRAPERAGI
jgi:hypothetical protein